MTLPSMRPLRVSIDRFLSDLDVLRLGLRDSELGLQLVRLRHAREVRSGSHFLADFDRELLKDALDTGANGECALSGSVRRS